MNMQTALTCVLLCFALLCCEGQALAQLPSPTPVARPTPSPTPLRLEIEFEGPWMFYVQKNFSGTTNSMLIAISPRVAFHHRPTFSMGDGYPVTSFGAYCVAFDDPAKNLPVACRSNSNQKLTTLPCPDAKCPPYADPNLVPIKKGDFNWMTDSKDAYVLILPMPDYYSADGQENRTFVSKGTDKKRMPAAIGIQLHYNSGPDNVNLLGCAPGSPSIDNCTTSLNFDPQANSGTLRISITSPLSDLLDLDCHVHVAYRTTIDFVDPDWKYNGDKVDIRSKCLLPPRLPPRFVKAKHGNNIRPSIDIAERLKSILGKRSHFGDCDPGFDNRPLCNLYQFSQSLRPKTPLRRSQLVTVNALVRQSVQQLARLARRGDKWALATMRQLRLFATQTLVGLDGVDCRALEMLIQD